MVATTAASMARLRQAIPAWSRPPTMAVLGVLLGSGFTQEMAARMPDWLPSLATLPLYILTFGSLALVYLRQVAGSIRSRRFSAPRRAGSARWRSWATAPAATCARSRWSTPPVPLIVLTVPADLPPASATCRRAARPHRPPGWLLDLAVLAAAGRLGRLADSCSACRPGLLGPMVLSAAAHLAGLVEGAPPRWLVAAAQIVIGARSVSGSKAFRRSGCSG